MQTDYLAPPSLIRKKKNTATCRISELRPRSYEETISCVLSLKTSTRPWRLQDFNKSDTSIVLLSSQRNLFLSQETQSLLMTRQVQTKCH